MPDRNPLSINFRACLAQAHQLRVYQRNRTWIRSRLLEEWVLAIIWKPLFLEFGLPTANETTHSYVRSSIFTKEFKPDAGGHETWHGRQLFKLMEAFVACLSLVPFFLRPFVSPASCSQLSKISRRGIWENLNMVATCFSVAGDVCWRRVFV